MSLLPFNMKIIEKLKLWKLNRSLKKFYKLNYPDPKLLIKDLELAIEILKKGEEAEEDSLPCKADNLYLIAYHLIKSISGSRVYPPIYSQYSDQFKLKHYIFGYFASTNNINAGLEPRERIPED